MCKVSLTVIIFYLSLHHAHQYYKTDYKINVGVDVDTNESGDHFDLLVFSQKWPVTICKYWTDVTLGGQCVYPIKKNQWTIHGIWPMTTEGYYPEFCNKSWAFDPEQIKGIEDDLNQAWTNNFKETEPYSFWEHEWVKHGTCATDLEYLNSQHKYFSKGIEWNKKYSLLDMLNAANILPSDTKKFTPEDFINAVAAKTNKNPMVVCSVFHGVQYLGELRICFDKNCNVIDCDPIVFKCDNSKKIIFPANA